MRVLQYFGAFLAWNVAASMALVLLDPLLGLLVTLVLGALLLWGYLLRADDPEHHLDLLRVRPLSGEQLRWTVVGVPVFLVFNWALGEVYIQLVPVPPENFDPFAALMADWRGRLAITVLAVAVAPILEELVFRGMIQGSIERRRGVAVGLLVTAVLFAVIHFKPWVLPLHVFLGLAFGYAVYATGSVYAGVILHAANNTAAMLATGLQDEPVSVLPTLWDTGLTGQWWASLAAALVSGALLAAVAVRLWKARPESGLRHAAADG